MLRLLIKDITVEKPLHPKQLLAHIRWQGGACSDIGVPLPPPRADRVRYPVVVVDRVRHLAQNLPDGEIAERLNQEGQLSALGKPFTGSMIQWIRYRYQIPKARLVRPEELTVQQVAESFRVSPNVVYYWIDRGVIPARQLNAGSPYWITLKRNRRTKAPRLGAQLMPDSDVILNAIGGTCTMKSLSGFPRVSASRLLSGCKRV